MQNKKIKREYGYYWVKTKRGVWMIARWWPSLNNGKGFWDTMSTIENDTSGGFVEIDERKIERYVKTSRHRKLSEPQKNNVEISQKVKRHRRKN